MERIYRYLLVALLAFLAFICFVAKFGRGVSLLKGIGGLILIAFVVASVIAFVIVFLFYGLRMYRASWQDTITESPSSPEPLSIRQSDASDNQIDSLPHVDKRRSP